MCGIFGGSPDLVSENAAKLLQHRGPNQSGQVLLHATNGAPIIIGQTRLSVVCKEDIITPFRRDGATITFNGEIYNWRQIRSELETKGVVFTTETDTEVVLCAYLAWGPACLERFNGMFALAIWHDDQLFLARDRVGKKPLFYSHGPRGLGFASELKAMRELDFGEVPICKSLEFYFDEHTPFRNVKSVRPGEYLRYRPATNEVERKTWWSFPFAAPEITDERVAVKQFLDLFEDACRIRKVADVPVTIFLSGGIDSSLIQAVLKLDVAYTVQFEEFIDKINERDLVQEFAQKLGFEPRIITPTREEFLDTFADLARYMEFPVGSFSVFPLFCLARASYFLLQCHTLWQF